MADCGDCGDCGDCSGCPTFCPCGDDSEPKRKPPGSTNLQPPVVVMDREPRYIYTNIK